MWFFMKNKAGFTLVELSIVLVIIGLIVAGVVGGQALIASARLSKQVQQLQQFKVSYNAFLLQYDAIPGDFGEATDYWPTAGTASGNGDGRLEKSTGSTNTSGGDFDGELPLFFEHLSLASLVPEQYDGSTDLGLGYPAMALNKGFGMIAGESHFYENAACRSSAVKLLLVVAVPNAMPDLDAADNAQILLPKDAKRIDQKLDNGLATSGSFCAWNSSGDATGNCHVTDGRYVVSQTAEQCRASFNLE
jgi:prepilin-type N-terminal cleavage/methylation domain-containing protein